MRALWPAPRSADVSARTCSRSTAHGTHTKSSETEIAASLTHQTDGVVAVVDKLAYHLDDSRLQPDEQTLHGVTDDWLRRL